MAENFSVERRRMMRFLGVKVVLTPASEKGSGMLTKAVELAEAHGWFLTRQFENEANANIHSETTAVEILEDFAEDGLDYWVTGFGTGGTLKGVARVLKEKSPSTRIIVCEPDNSQVLGSEIPQSRNPDGSVAESHPLFRPHAMQGWAPDFISKLTEDAVELIDSIVPVAGDDSLRLSRELAQKEGIFVGITAGATLAGALKICEGAPQGSNILCMLPDTGERYLTTPLFEDIPVEMSEEEITISRSTPACRFDAPPPKPAPEDDAVAVPVTEEAIRFTEEVLNDSGQPVALFALEWCEFCWSLRKMFAKYEIPYRSIDLDSVAYQEDNRGGEIRAVLTDKTGMKTIPQVFVGGEFIGGCTEVFDACRDGSLQKLLDQAHVQYDKTIDTDPYSFLPTWLHPR
jgi:cysteine synthase A